MVDNKNKNKYISKLKVHSKKDLHFWFSDKIVKLWMARQSIKKDV